MEENEGRKEGKKKGKKMFSWSNQTREIGLTFTLL